MNFCSLTRGRISRSVLQGPVLHVHECGWVHKVRGRKGREESVNTRSHKMLVTSHDGKAFNVYVCEG